MPPGTLRTVEQPGLRWSSHLFGHFPAWAEEPSDAIMKKLVAHHLQLDDEPELFFFAEGALNKLYAFECSKGRFLMRVTLPVAPKVKTDSEVATLNFVRNNTSIPVPRVIAHDSNLKNELGFEWMIMERVEAQTLDHAWLEMSWLKKQLLVQQVASICAKLFETRLSAIGSFCSGPGYSDREDANRVRELVVGEIVRPNYFMEDAIKLDIDRGPYNSSRNYLSARLEILRHKVSKLLESEDEEDVEDGERMERAVDRLEEIIPRFFPHKPYIEATQLHHSDISINNILVDSNGDLASIVDWECVAILPDWQACELPQFLVGESVALTELPREPRIYGDAEQDSNNARWHKEKVIDYEASQLRDFFFEEMQRLSPKWMEIYRREQVRRDIVLAMDYSDNGLTVYRVFKWAKTVLEGIEPNPNLRDGCQSPDALDGSNWV